MHALWLLCLTLLAGGTSSETADDCLYRNLLKYLKLDVRNYELAEVRPALPWNQSTEVNVDLFLMGILNVDEKSQTLTTFITLSVLWNNTFLKWDPSAFCGINYISVPREKLWKPDILIFENIFDSDVPNSPYARVYWSGQSQLIDVNRLTTICKMDLYRFPFDTQTCSINFRSAVHTLDEITLGAFTDINDMNEFVKTSMISLGEWEFVSINMSEYLYTIDYFNYQNLIYTITLKRRPLLYIINLLVPITSFLILDVASFFISEARGEKLGFKVTILLSISVLLLILQDILPSTAEQLPLIALYCIVIFMLIGLSLLETMVVSFLVDMDCRVDEDAEASSKTSTDAKDDAGYKQEPVGHLESCLEMMEENKPEKKDLDVEWLKQILEEAKASRQISFSANVQQGMRKTSYYKTMARRIDIVYFCFYLITAIGFLVFIYIEWFC